MDNLQGLGDRLSIRIPPDEDGFTGHECPQSDCEGYFKVQFGTGLKGEGVPCHCPYCGYTASHDGFWTKEQIEYAKSVAIQKITGAIHADLKELEFNHKPQGPFGIGISLKVTSGPPAPLHYYREKQLETEVICSSCTLRYSVYGVFAFCPDCGQHNSLQILSKNLEVVVKILDLATGADKELAERLIENALEDCVSAFDGFGRELCRIHRENATDPNKADRVSFQNLEGAKSAILGMFRVDLSTLLTADEWKSAICGFQKRHIVAHKMGVVDQDYITRTGDTQAVHGRKISLGAEEIQGLIMIISKLAQGFSHDLQHTGKNL